MGSVSGKSSSLSYYTRRAYHAGSWYDNDEKILQTQLENFLEQATGDSTSTTTTTDTSTTSTTDAATTDGTTDSTTTNTTTSLLRAVIVPHAGYTYSGSTAAYSYNAVLTELQKDNTPIRKILVLHPSHHVYLPGMCSISNAEIIQTPLGNLHVDNELRNEILALNNNKKLFTIMNKSDDEHEHSGEMQYPYIAYCLKQVKKLETITVTPLMCGSLKTLDEKVIGEALHDIISRPDILTIISTDFCHWGKRFNYQPFDNNINNNNSNSIPIYEYIEQLDKRGIDLITLQKPGGFVNYIKETQNTICGRHAISVYLRAIDIETATGGNNNNNNNLSINFVKYEQSSKSMSMTDSSVSYAAALVTLNE